MEPPQRKSTSGCKTTRPAMEMMIGSGILCHKSTGVRSAIARRPSEIIFHTFVGYADAEQKKRLELSSLLVKNKFRRFFPTI